jgi:hypothetical protein
MPLKNYTTEVPAERSVSQIQGNLVTHGARDILIHFGADKEPESMSFIIPTPQGDIPFRLPANVQKVAAVLAKNININLPEWHANYQKYLLNAKERARKKASNVAWRIIKDWVDSQLAIIETEMVTLEQVFLPYLIVKGNQSLFEAMKDKGFYLTEGKKE